MSQKEKDQRKERVLHTRVSEQLDEELKEKAAGLGVSVSNLVRNILLNTLEMVEDIVADSGSIAKAAKKKHHGSDPEPATGHDGTESVILGWQVLTLNLNAICECCNRVLPRGNDAALAVYAGTGPRVFRCVDCIPTDDEGPTS